MTLPEPIDVPWTMKPVTSALCGVEVLDDGRLHCSIRHDVILGVTPAMLAWWFDHIDGELAIEGVPYPRYRVWHPRDHVSHTYVRGRGRGATFRIHEVLARNPDWQIDVKTVVTQLDESGFAHRPRPHGLPIVRMDYAFSRCAGGTQYVNSLTFGLPGKPRLNTLLRKLAFSLDKAHAWLRHNVEEVGNFEFFLPALYAAETGRRA
jgi:hypothetical protein